MMTIGYAIVQRASEDTEASASLAFGLIQRDVGSPLQVALIDMLHACEHNTDGSADANLNAAEFERSRRSSEPPAADLMRVGILAHIGKQTEAIEIDIEECAAVIPAQQRLFGRREGPNS
jgi:hypothetical protein